MRRFLLGLLLALVSVSLCSAQTSPTLQLPAGFQLPAGASVPAGLDLQKLLQDYENAKAAAASGGTPSAPPTQTPAPAQTSQTPPSQNPTLASPGASAAAQPGPNASAQPQPGAPQPAPGAPPQTGSTTPAGAQTVAAPAPTTAPAPAVPVPEAKPEELHNVLADIKQSSAPAPDEKLAVFGFDLFQGSQTFQPLQGVAVPDSYVVGPGDTFQVNLWGRLEAQYTLTIDNEGKVLFPKVGPLRLSNLTYAEARRLLKARAEAITGVSASATLGSTRTLQVFVVGEAQKPGTYTLPPFATTIHAILAAGGPTSLGSLRRVALRRSGRVVAGLDLYSFILHGSLQGDRPLENGDVIVLPRAETQVWLYGKVRRPAVYELRRGEGLRALLDFAGGLSSDAYGGRIQVERSEKNQARVVLDVAFDDLKGDFPLRDGDVVRAFPLKPEVENRVGLYGHVYQPGTYSYRKGMRVAELLGSSKNLMPDVDLTYAVVLRETGADRAKETVPFRPGAALDGSDPVQNLELRPGDEVYVFSRYRFGPPLTAQALGEVRSPGLYRFERGARVADLVRLAGGLTSDALKEEAQLFRTDPLTKEKSFVSFPLGKALAGDPKANLPLQDLDQIVVYSGAKLVIPRTAKIEGMVKKPGDYPLGEGLRVGDLVLKAEGLTRDAYLKEAHIYRTDPATKEVTLRVFDLGKALEGDPSQNLLVQDLDDVVVHSAYEFVPPQKVSILGWVNKPGDYPSAVNLHVRDLVLVAGGLQEGAFLDEAEVKRFVTVSGREMSVKTLTFQLGKAMEGDPEENLALEPYDKVLIRKIPEWKQDRSVTLSGEVRFPGVYYIAKGERLSSVLARAGGYNDTAYLKGAMFTRESAREQQQARLDELRDRLQQAMLRESSAQAQASLNPEDVAAAKAYLASQQELLQKLANTKATGRVVLKLLALDQLQGSEWDVALENGDTVSIPKQPQTVSVVGQVFNPTSLLFEPDARSVGHYLGKTGGPTQDAEKDQIYVVRADGTVVSNEKLKAQSWWAKGITSIELDPGDTILVPERIVRPNYMRDLRDMTQILYQIAVTAGVAIAIL